MTKKELNNKIEELNNRIEELWKAILELDGKIIRFENDVNFLKTIFVDKIEECENSKKIDVSKYKF